MLRSARFAAAFASGDDSPDDEHLSPPDGDVPTGDDPPPVRGFDAPSCSSRTIRSSATSSGCCSSSKGDSVLEAKDGDDALTVVHGYQGALDLLLTDVMMPGLSGAEVCERVREGRPGLPTLFISGFYPEAVFPDQRLPEGSAFLAKPFMPEELIDAVDELLGEPVGATPAGPRARRAAPVLGAPASPP